MKIFSIMDVPLEFHLNLREDLYEVYQLLIEENGGKVDDLIEENTVILTTRDFYDDSDENRHQYDIQYIKDCIKQRKMLDPIPYKFDEQKDYGCAECILRYGNKKCQCFNILRSIIEKLETTSRISQETDRVFRGDAGLKSDGVPSVEETPELRAVANERSQPDKTRRKISSRSGSDTNQEEGFLSPLKRKMLRCNLDEISFMKRLKSEPCSTSEESDSEEIENRSSGSSEGFTRRNRSNSSLWKEGSLSRKGKSLGWRNKRRQNSESLDVDSEWTKYAHSAQKQDSPSEEVLEEFPWRKDLMNIIRKRDTAAVDNSHDWFLSLTHKKLENSTPSKPSDLCQEEVESCSSLTRVKKDPDECMKCSNSLEDSDEKMQTRTELFTQRRRRSSDVESSEFDFISCKREPEDEEERVVEDRVRETDALTEEQNEFLVPSVDDVPELAANEDSETDFELTQCEEVLRRHQEENPCLSSFSPKAKLKITIYKKTNGRSDKVLQSKSSNLKNAGFPKNILELTEKVSSEREKDEYGYPKSNSKVYQTWEKEAMLDFIIQRNKFSSCNTNSVWQELQNLKILPKRRTWTSMRSEFVNNILPNIKSFNLPTNIEKIFLKYSSLRNRELKPPSDELLTWARDITKKMKKDKDGYPISGSINYKNWERRMIVDFLVEAEMISRAKILNTWQLALDLKIFPRHRTKEGLRTFFIRYVLPKIEEFNLPEEIESQFLKLKPEWSQKIVSGEKYQELMNWAKELTRKDEIDEPSKSIRDRLKDLDKKRMVEFVIRTGQYYKARKMYFWNLAYDLKLFTVEPIRLQRIFIKEILPNISDYKLQPEIEAEFSKVNKPYLETIFEKPSQEIIDWAKEVSEKRQKDAYGYPLGEIKIEPWEMKLMVEYIIKTGRLDKALTYKIWDGIIKLKVLPRHRTSDNLLSAFQNKILPNIKNFDLSPEIERDFRKLYNLD